MTVDPDGAPALPSRGLDAKDGSPEMLLTPPAGATLPNAQLRITWSGLLNGERPRAVALAGDRVLQEFDGYTEVPGFRPTPADENQWFCELARLPAEIDTVYLRVQPLTASTIRASISTIRSSEDAFEHAGIEVTPGTDAYVFSFTREGGDWQLRALNGHPVIGTGGGVARAGKGLLVVVDGSASMLRWYDSGAVTQLIEALREDAERTGVSRLRLTTTGRHSGTVRSLHTHDNVAVARLIREHLATEGLHTQADVVATAAGVLASTPPDTVTVLVTDGLPTGAVSRLLTTDRSTVIAVLGASIADELSDHRQLEELRRHGFGVALLGDGQQSHGLIIDEIGNALSAAKD